MQEKSTLKLRVQILLRRKPKLQICKSRRHFRLWFLLRRMKESRAILLTICRQRALRTPTFLTQIRLKLPRSRRRANLLQIENIWLLRLPQPRLTLCLQSRLMPRVPSNMPKKAQLFQTRQDLTTRCKRISHLHPHQFRRKKLIK
jgi:hypothetical protein